MPIPTKNIFWRDIPANARVVDRGNYFEVTDGRKRMLAFWTGREAREAQRALSIMAKQAKR